MALNIKLLFLLTGVFQSNGVSFRRQLDHIAKTNAESRGLPIQMVPSRRDFYKFDPRELSPILGVPSIPSHLPEAEPILPGHTLLKPAMGMLKSAVKFPHKDFEDGSGVYGNYENIGIRYDSKNERLLNTGFRRMLSDYIVVVPPEPGNSKMGPSVVSAVLDLDPKESNNKMSLYLNDNKVLLSEQKNRGPIYLKRILIPKLPRSNKIIDGEYIMKTKPLYIKRQPWNDDIFMNDEDHME